MGKETKHKKEERGGETVRNKTFPMFFNTTKIIE